MALFIVFMARIAYICSHVHRDRAQRHRNSPPAILLREGWREGKKVRKRTLANLSHLPKNIIELIRRALKGEAFVAVSEAFEVIKSSLHGHVNACRTTMRRLRFDKLLASKPCRERNLVEAMVAARILEPDSKLATTRWWHTTTLPESLGVADANEDDLYAAMDWLLERQERIEKKTGWTTPQKRRLGALRVLMRVSIISICISLLYTIFRSHRAS